MSKTKKLTKAEHFEMELNAEQLNSVKLQKEILLEKKANKLLKIKIMELENQRAIMTANNNLDAVAQRISAAEKEVVDFNKKIMDKYKVKQGFGINPDTGEIIE